MLKNSTEAVKRQISVPFYGANLLLLEHDGQPYTPMKPLVAAIGVSWQGQHEKMSANRERWGIKEILMPSAGGKQSAICIPVRKLFGWLMTMEPNKIKNLGVRERVIQYQNECDDVLWKYWTEGVAINERMAFAVNSDDVLTGEQQEVLRLMVKTHVERLPKLKQGAAATKVWSKLKAHFKVAYRQIPQSEFTEAVSIVTRTAAEWEVLEAEPKQETDLIAVIEQMDALDALRRILSGDRWLLSFDDDRWRLKLISRDAYILTEKQIVGLIGEPGIISERLLPSIIAVAAERLTHLSPFRIESRAAA
ncbi:phage antirepressor N-terminal domain-containing protein [Pandoraea sp. PE-S2T-3]|uniref:phage antirepressor N-terminal domain-containing protein n=1 Tax=Pandoraea sp. PE-S2T-3 TaxID=1986993 RepID=UPI000B40689F|nr:phage antirepressor N-terminal domain-containing protein [Pandoraea sp. PE-S2T-3]